MSSPHRVYELADASVQDELALVFLGSHFIYSSGRRTPEISLCSVSVRFQHETFPQNGFCIILPTSAEFIFWRGGPGPSGLCTAMLIDRV